MTNDPSEPNERFELPEKPVWEKHTSRGLYTIDRVFDTPSDSEENAVEMFLVNRTSVRAREKVHEVRYYRSQDLAEAAVLRHDETGEWTTDGEILDV
jgi:hypothetical protein